MMKVAQQHLLLSTILFIISLLFSCSSSWLSVSAQNSTNTTTLFANMTNTSTANSSSMMNTTTIMMNETNSTTMMTNETTMMNSTNTTSTTTLDPNMTTTVANTTMMNATNTTSSNNTSNNNSSTTNVTATPSMDPNATTITESNETTTTADPSDFVTTSFDIMNGTTVVPPVNITTMTSSNNETPTMENLTLPSNLTAISSSILIETTSSDSGNNKGDNQTTTLIMIETNLTSLVIPSTLTADPNATTPDVFTTASGAVPTTTNAASIETFAPPTTTVAAGLPSDHPYQGFYLVFKPSIIPTQLAAGVSNTSSLQSYMRREIITMLTRTGTDASALNPVGFNAALLRQNIISSLRADLSHHVNMPAGDIGVDSILKYSGDSTGESVQITFRVSAIRGTQISASLNASVGASSASYLTSWMSSTMNQFSEAAAVACNTSTSLMSAGILGGAVETGVLVQASPDDTASGGTTASPLAEGGSRANAACFVDGGDCSGTIIVIVGLVSFIVAIAVSIKLYWDSRKNVIAQRNLEAQFEKEVKARNEVRSKVVKGQQEEEKTELSQTLRQRDEEAKRQKQIQQQQAIEVEMEMMRQHQIQQQQQELETQRYHQQLLQQQQQQVQQQQQQQFHNPRHHGQIHDGLLGTSDRSHQYVAPQQQQQNLAQTYTPQHHQQRSYQQQQHDYDDFL